MSPVVAEISTSILRDGAGPPSVDLIVDATADRVVRTPLERRRAAARDAWPTVATLMIGHEAARGVAAVSLPGASGGPADILRRLGLTARADASGRLADVVDDFPEPSRTDFFQPEPGCSDVTFTGGAADVIGLAAQLFAGVLRRLNQHADGVDVDPMAALVVRMPHDPPPTTPARGDRPACCRGADLADLAERHGAAGARDGLDVRIAASALAEMRAEARRGARLRRRELDTGGLLIGSFDDPAGGVRAVGFGGGAENRCLLRCDGLRSEHCA